MIASATTHPIHLPHAPLLGLRPGATLPLSVAPTPGPAGRAGIDFFRADFHDARWIELDDTADAADAADLTREAAAADAALLRCVACVAFATMVLAVVSSLPLA
jgi:hypothetical protein